jgi:diaminopimelate decarboxylase
MVIVQTGQTCITHLFPLLSDRFALQARVAFNLDNFQELERTAALIAADPHLIQQHDPSAQPRLIGLRINPQVSIST